MHWLKRFSHPWSGMALGGGFGRVFRVGPQPVNISLAGFYKVEKPDAIGPDYTVRFTVQFLFPR